MPLRHRPGIGLGLAVCFVFTSCNTLPLGGRSWLELRTPHYDIISSLDANDTAALARDAEHFRRAAEYVLGRPIPPPPIRTRIYAFDGRSVRRPFDVGGEPSYLLPRLRGDVIVLRGGGGWTVGEPPVVRSIQWGSHIRTGRPGATSPDVLSRDSESGIMGRESDPS